MSGPGAGGIQTASAVLSDVVSIISGEAPVHEAGADLAVVSDVTSSFYLHLEVADRPGVLAQIAKVLGDNEVSVKSVVQRGIGDDARLVMVLHECRESNFAAAVDAIAELEEHALSASLDPRDRGGVRLRAPWTLPVADRALPRPAAARGRRPGRHPRTRARRR